jgi:hypothetical protein
MARIFVSYRRHDSAGHAGRLYDHLRDYFGSSRVFMDVEGIEPGTDFTQVLDERIARAEVVIAVVGPNWLPAAGARGSGRIDRTEDYVFREIATAFARGVEVIPVLVAGAAVPPRSELPDELADLTRRHMYAVNDTAFAASLARLIRAVERSAARTRERRRLAPRPATQIAKRWWARLLLLYEPTRPAMWILHILFFLFFVLLLFEPIALWSATHDLAMAFAAVSSVGLFVVFIRGLVLILEPDEVVSPLRRWFLLYNPPRTIMTAVHFLFFVMLLGCGLALPVMIEMIRRQTNDVARIALAEGWLSFVAATFVIREIGAANDPLKSPLTEPTWFARLFCMWKPRHGLAWLPRIVFYCSCWLFAGELPLTLVGADGNFGKIDLAQNRGVFLLCAATLALTVSARGAARAIEVNWSGDYTQGTAQRLRRALLLYRPWRLTGWIPTALFWLAVAITIVGLASPSALHWFGIAEGKGWTLTTRSGLVAVCAWTWSAMYRPPSK